ncbi:MAG: hypothetical protein GY833_19195 [Aestuariibacter sp.]|nr:hypothetical protein [Aestuariibacter sp.]
MAVGALGCAAIGAVAGWTGYVLANPGGRPEDYLASHDFWRAGQVGLASGVVAGAVGWAVPALLPAAGGFWGAVGIGALTGSLAGGAGQITSNLLTARLVNPCVKWHHNLVQSMIIGGVIGGAVGGAGFGIRQWMANRIGSITPPSSPGGLRRAMGTPPQGMQKPQAHHNLPWKFRNWFAGPRRGLNVNNPSFGRWVEGTPPGQHQNWSRAYNDVWEAFIQQNPAADKWHIQAFLKQLLSSGRFP